MYQIAHVAPKALGDLGRCAQRSRCLELIRLVTIAAQLDVTRVVTAQRLRGWRQQLGLVRHDLDQYPDVGRLAGRPRRAPATVAPLVPLGKDGMSSPPRLEIQATQYGPPASTKERHAVRRYICEKV